MVTGIILLLLLQVDSMYSSIVVLGSSSRTHSVPQVYYTILPYLAKSAIIMHHMRPSPILHFTEALQFSGNFIAVLLQKYLG